MIIWTKSVEIHFATSYRIIIYFIVDYGNVYELQRIFYLNHITEYIDVSIRGLSDS